MAEPIIIQFISIHAPAKGATDKNSIIPPDLKISIHAPAKGATIIGVGDQLVQLISIHAPAKGATPGLLR